MVIFPNCKINLGLRILQKRDDGFHDLETVFYPLNICDILEFLPVHEGLSTFSNTGITVTGDPEQNLCRKAWKLLKTAHPELPDINIWLHKVIPTGAGLGGGSADGAFLLKALNQKFHLGVTEQALSGYALQLGSDCPFFLRNSPCTGKGRGEILEPVAADLSAYHITLVHPGIHVSTAWAFGQVKPDKQSGGMLEEIISEGPENWRGRLINDFEQPVMHKHPEIGAIREKLYDLGALYASLTGSGSAVFGIFREHVSVKGLFPHGYFIRELQPAASFETQGK